MNLHVYENSIPAQLCCSFRDSSCSQRQGRCVPYCVCIPAACGRYKVHVRIAADRDIEEALLFETHRRLLWKGKLAGGSTVQLTALCAVHPFIREDEGFPAQAEEIQLALIGQGGKIDSVTVEPVNAPALLLMGDSTVTDQEAMSPYAPGATYCGWGQMMPFYLGEHACVINHAYPGLTVETFRESGRYELLKRQARRGDIVLMQFGHNDQKRPHLQADGGYTDALLTYIDELRTMGVHPVVVTPLARNSWWNEREYHDLLSGFSAAAQRVAQTRSIPCIDLHRFMMDFITAHGRDAVKNLFHIGDYSHTNDFGAYMAAGFVASELRRLKVVDTLTREPWPPRAPYDIPAQNQGDESLPPEGIEALYRSLEKRGDDLLTCAEALELVCRTFSLFSINVDTELPADVEPDAPYAEPVRCALQNRLIPEHMLRDGCLHPCEPIARRDFMSIYTRGHRMRKTVDFTDSQAGMISRREAAALCRNTHKIIQEDTVL